MTSLLLGVSLLVLVGNEQTDLVHFWLPLGLAGQLQVGRSPFVPTMAREPDVGGSRPPVPVGTAESWLAPHPSPRGQRLVCSYLVAPVHWTSGRLVNAARTSLATAIARVAKVVR